MHKLKNIILLAGLLAVLTTARGQQVINISSKNTFKNGSVYFVDMPLSIAIKRYRIKDPAGIIPPALFSHINFPAPAAMQAFFELQENSKKGEAVINYKGDAKPAGDAHGDKILISYTESIGSACCPRDPATVIYGRLAKFNTDFERQHKVKLGKVYTYTYGDEGESTIYYTLSGLTPQLKAQFIYERTQLLNNARNPKHPLTPTVYFPGWITKEKFIKENL